MIMRVVALINTPKGKFARLRSCGKSYYGHESPMMALLDVKNEERGLKLGEVVEVQFTTVPEAPAVTPELPASAVLISNGTAYEATAEGLAQAKADIGEGEQGAN